MNRTTLPAPPDPAKYQSVQDWMRAAHRWMVDAKARIEQDSTVNTVPMAPFVVSTYTAVNTITGTDATSNVVATLLMAMQQKGLTAPVSQRTT
jgi:hypothetical protein